MAHSGNWGALFVPAAQIMKAKGIGPSIMMPYTRAVVQLMQALLKGDAEITMGFPGNADQTDVDSGEGPPVLATAGTERMV